ncbi:RNase P subunit [Candidatus Nitrosopumilus koreensis AR1]|uniref:Ribonuclease P protein component 4 n=2 Tax=Nitrosopumilaceae TaxID=338190 RepID=K0B7Y6_9ARCH|nr:RNase P subunit [Candidatus Nitrosopumilus koreensis AR1]
MTSEIIVKPAVRKLAMERMHILIKNAISNAKENPKLSQRQALLARRISTRHKIRMPYELRMVFCKKCKSFIAPGVNSRIRLGRASVKSIRISCYLCGHTYRKIISQ